MMHPTRAGLGLVETGGSGFVARNPEDEVRGKGFHDPEGQRIGSVEDRRDDRALPLYGDTGRPFALIRGGTAPMSAEGPSPARGPAPTSGEPHATSQETMRRAVSPLPGEAKDALVALSLAMKWAGVALLVGAGLLAVYLGAGLLGELAARAAFS